MSEGERLDAAVDQAVALRQSVDALTTAIMGAVPKQDKRFRQSVILLLIGGPALFVATMAFATYSIHQAHSNERVLRNGVACLLADLDDHRHTNQNAHNTLATAHHIEIIQPDLIPLSKSQVDALKQSCDTYVRAAVGQGLRSVGGKAANAHP
jgi:hypothetical protein